MAKHNTLGKAGEQQALQHLLNKNYTLLESNYKAGKAEVDIIMQDKNFIVLVEVKTRSTNYFGTPEESVNDKKQNLLRTAAEAYMEQNNLDLEIRFDIVSVLNKGSQFSIHHIVDAFR